MNDSQMLKQKGQKVKNNLPPTTEMDFIIQAIVLQDKHLKYSWSYFSPDMKKLHVLTRVCWYWPNIIIIQ